MVIFESLNSVSDQLWLWSFGLAHTKKKSSNDWICSPIKLKKSQCVYINNQYIKDYKVGICRGRVDGQQWGNQRSMVNSEVIDDQHCWLLILWGYPVNTAWVHIKRDKIPQEKCQLLGQYHLFHYPYMGVTNNNLLKTGIVFLILGNNTSNFKILVNKIWARRQNHSTKTLGIEINTAGCKSRKSGILIF